MEVILLKDVEKLGKKGDIVDVRDGFGRNFLLPRAFAQASTRENRLLIESEKKLAARRRTREKNSAQKLAERLVSLKLRIEVEAGEKDKLFGAVTSQDLAEALKAEGVTLDKRQILLPGPLRTLGFHSVTLELDREIKPTVQVEIIKKSR